MQAFRAALLSFADDGSARYEEDGLLVVGPEPGGRKVVRAAGAYGAVAARFPGVAVTHQWGDYYKRRTQAVLEGSWKSGNVWGGVKEGMIRVGYFGSKVPKAVQEEVRVRQKDIAAGRLRPFAGPIADNEGKPVVGKGQGLTDGQILGMNFLVSGVQGKVRQ